MHSKIGKQPHKLSLLSKLTKPFALMIGDRDNTLPFCFKDFFVLFKKLSSIFRFIYYPSLLVVVNDRINQLFFLFVLVEPLHLLDVFRAFPQLQTKNNCYTKNLKHPLETKNATLLRTKHVIF